MDCKRIVATGDEDIKGSSYTIGSRPTPAIKTFCDDCERVIERYEYREVFLGLSGSEGFAHSRCVDCQSIHRTFFVGHGYADLIGDLRRNIEHIVDMPASCFGQLTLRAAQLVWDLHGASK